MSQAEAAGYLADPGRFWASLLLLQLLGWVLLLWAGRRISIGWRTRPEPTSGTISDLDLPVAHYRIPDALWRDRPQERRALLERDPMRWLVSRRRESRLLVWCAFLLYPLFHLSYPWILSRIAGLGAVQVIVTASYFAAWLTSQFLLAVVAARPLAEARASGMLEVLLGSPISTRQMERALWWGLWRQIRLPLVVLTVGPIVVEWLRLDRPWARMGGTSFYWWYMLATLLLIPVQLLAVCRLAMWFGFRMRSTTRAAGLTVFWTMLVPYILQSVWRLAMSYARPSMGSGSPPATLIFYLLLVSESVINLGLSLIHI